MNPPGEDHPVSPEPLVRRAALVAFPVVLWLVATLALGGAIGKRTDDYSTDLRDPVTGGLPGGFHPYWEYAYFWRPAHIALIHAIQTFLGEHERLVHVLSAAAHGLVCVLLYRVSRRLTGSAPAGAAASVLFMVQPVVSDGALFTSFISGPIAAALWLWLVDACARRAVSGGRLGGVWIGAATVVALAIPFFYEQPGAAVAAMPLVWVACRARGVGTGRGLARGTVASLPLVLAQAAVAAALIGTAPAGRRGSAGSLKGPEQWPARIGDVATQTVELLAGRRGQDLVVGGLKQAWPVLTSTHLWVWLVVLGLSGGAWALAILGSAVGRGEAPAAGAEADPPARCGVAALFGLIAAALTLAPAVLVSGQSVAPRMLYAPLACGSISLAAAIAWVLSRVPARARGWAVAFGGVVLGATASVLAISCVGTQAALAARSRADSAIAGQLSRLFPGAPPYTLFAPIRMDQRVAATGRAGFDDLHLSAFQTIWSSTALVRQTLHRRDVWAGAWRPWRGATLRDPGTDTVTLDDRFVVWSPYREEAGRPGAVRGTIVPWSLVAPFTVDEHGRVHPVRRIVFVDAAGRETVRTSAIVEEGIRAGHFRPALAVRVRLPEDSRGR